MEYRTYTYNGVTCQATRRRSSDTQKKYERNVKYNGQERKVTYGDKEMPMRRTNDQAQENFLSRHNCSDKKDPFASGFWACLDWARPSEKSADFSEDLYEGYLISFDGNDLVQERFTEDTNFWLDYIQPKMITFHHLKNKELFDKPELFVTGEIDGIEIDEKGVKAYFHLYKRLPKNFTDKLAWFDETVREEHSKWLGMVKEYLEDGLLGFSTDSIESLVKRSDSPEKGVTDIESWAIPFVSLTHIPAEPRNIINPIIKSVGDIIVMETEQVMKPLEEESKGGYMMEGMMDEKTYQETLKKVMEDNEYMRASMEEMNKMMQEYKGMMQDYMRKASEASITEEIESNSQSAYDTNVGVQKSLPKIIENTEPVISKGVVNMATPLKYNGKSDFLLALKAFASKDLQTVKAIGFTQSDSGVGFLMPEEYSNNIIDLLQPKSLFLNGGFAGSLVNFYPMSTNSMVIPTVVSGTSGSWIDEGTTLPESSMKFGSVRLNAKKYGFVIHLNNDTLADSSIALETKVREQMVRDLAIAVDRAILDGIGGAQPLGLGRTSGVNIVSKGSTVGFTDLLSAIDRIEARDVILDDSTAWIFPSSIKALLRKMVSPANDYIWTDTPNLSQAALGSAPTPLLGYKWNDSNIITKGMAGGDSDKYTMFFGKWSDIIVGMRMNIELSSNENVNWMLDQTSIRAMIRLDVAVTHPESFEIIKNITLT